MRVVQTYLSPVLLGSLLITGGCATLESDPVRPGHKTTDIIEQIVPGDSDRWVMTIHEKGYEPTAFNIASTMMESKYFDETYEMVLPEAKRKEVRRNLERQGYDGVMLTEHGVAYRLQKTVSRDQRLIRQSYGHTRSFEPHDCSRVIGTCEFVQMGGRENEFYVRTSDFKDGVWTDRLHRDPNRDYQERSNLVQERRFSVDERGVLLDMEQLTHTAGQIVQTTWKRQARTIAEAPSTPAERLTFATLPDGAGNELQLECAPTDTAFLMVGGTRNEIAVGEHIAVPITEGAAMQLICNNAHGTIAPSITCTDDGHVRARVTEKGIIAGCFSGQPPADSWQQG